MTAPILPTFDLSGRIALITGGAGLLGREHAAALAMCGATVIVTDLDEVAAGEAVRRLSEELPAATFVPLRMDVTDASAVSYVCDYVIAHHGAVDVLVNNAAIDPKVRREGLVETSRLECFSLDSWRLQVDVGLTGAFLCCQVFGAWMAAHGGGVILNIASDLSVIAPDQRLYREPGRAPAEQPAKPVTYSVIKTGLIGLTRYVATYWADRGVRVNALSPGGVYAGQPDEFVQRLSALIPLGRMAARAEYRAAVQFLCSNASSYMTGQNIIMDGGRSVL